MQNYPILGSARPSILTSVQSPANVTHVTGTIDTERSLYLFLDFYESPSCSSSGYGEGRTYIGQTVLLGDIGQSGPMPFDVPNLASVPVGHVITATATTWINSPGGTSQFTTSEFSACRIVAPTGVSITPTGSLVTTEAGGAATVSVSLQFQPAATVTIPLSSSNTHEGTVSPASLTFTPDNWSVGQTVTVTGVNDQVADGDATYTLVLGPATSDDVGYSGLDPTDVFVTNKEVDITAALSIADVNIAEGNSGTTATTFTVTLAPASAQTVTVQYATADGTATAPSDYAVVTGTLTFAPGQTQKTVAVSVVGDTAVEPDESFTVSLTNPSNATIQTGRATGTIRNDDVAAPPPPSALSIMDINVAEGNAGAMPATFTVTLTPASSQPVTVQYATADGNATAPSDYAITRGTLTFAPGETRKAVTVMVVGDTTLEADEVFLVNLSNPSNAIIQVGQGRGTIRNDDTATPWWPH